MQLKQQSISSSNQPDDRQPLLIRFRVLWVHPNRERVWANIPAHTGSCASSVPRHTPSSAGHSGDGSAEFRAPPGTQALGMWSWDNIPAGDSTECVTLCPFLSLPPQHQPHWHLPASLQDLDTRGCLILQDPGSQIPTDPKGPVLMLSSEITQAAEPELTPKL